MERAIGKLSQIPKGEGRNFALQGAAGAVQIAVFHTHSGEVFATQAECPHKGGPLADGLTDEATVVCPLHDRTFAFADGVGIGTDCNIKVYPVRTELDGTILVLAEPGGS